LSDKVAQVGRTDGTCIFFSAFLNLPFPGLHRFNDSEMKCLPIQAEAEHYRIAQG